MFVYLVVFIFHQNNITNIRINYNIASRHIMIFSRKLCDLWWTFNTCLIALDGDFSNYYFVYVDIVYLPLKYFFI